MIDIAGLDKAAVLAALHNGTRSIGMGRMHDLGRDMTVEEAAHIMSNPRRPERALDFDYVQGRPLKADITGDSFDEWLYDRDAGQGAAARAIARLRASKETA